MEENEDDAEVTGRPQSKGQWIGDHWVVRKTGYCKACDGDCSEKPRKINGIHLGKTYD